MRRRFLIASLMVFLVSIITGDAYLHGKIYTLNMCAAGWTAFALDAIRMPYKIVLYTVRFSMTPTLSGLEDKPGPQRHQRRFSLK